VSEPIADRAEYGEDEYVMTEAEAAALRDTNNRNPPKIPARQLRESALDELTKQAQELDMGYGDDDK